MTLTLQADPVPLRIDEHGTIRVGSSRLTLDVLIEEYEGGASPEAIVQAFDTQIGHGFFRLAILFQKKNLLLERLSGHRGAF